MLSKDEKDRYSRHLILDGFGIEAQEKLKNARVLVVGAGGLGCPVIQYLTAVGVGTLGVIDDDTVSFSNLQRQILFSPEDVGVPKVEAVKTYVNRFNSNVAVEVFNERLTKENALPIMQKFDVVVDGSDNFATRYLVNDATQLLVKPLVFGSIFKYSGQVTVFNYNNGPSYRCLYPEPPEQGSMPACGEIGVLGVLPGIIGCQMANEVIKVVTGIGEVLSGKLMSYDALNNTTAYLKFRKSEQTITKLEDDYEMFCGVKPLSSTVTVSELAESLKQGVQLLDVREYSEIEIASIGGKHIPMNDIPNRYHELNPSKPVFVLCHHGMRSAMVQQWLLENTEVKAINVEGGIHAWSCEVDATVPVY